MNTSQVRISEQSSQNLIGTAKMGVIFFGALSLLFNFLLYKSFSNDPVYRIAYVSLGVGLNVFLIFLTIIIPIFFFNLRAHVLSGFLGVVWLLLLGLSISAGFGFMSLAQSDTQSQKLAASIQVSSAKDALTVAQNQLNSLSQYADPSQSIDAKSQLDGLVTKRDALLNSRAQNSRGTTLNATVSDKVGGCTGNNWYQKKYCPQLSQLSAAMLPLQTAIANHNKYLSAQIAVADRGKMLASLNTSNVNLSSTYHPLFINLGSIQGSSANSVMLTFLSISSILAELATLICMIIIMKLSMNSVVTMYEVRDCTQSASGYTQSVKPPDTAPQIEKGKNGCNDGHTRENDPDYTQSASDQNEAFLLLTQGIQNSVISNSDLSYKGMKKWLVKKGMVVNQPTVKRLRIALSKAGLAVFDSTRKLIVVTPKTL